MTVRPPLGAVGRLADQNATEPDGSIGPRTAAPTHVTERQNACLLWYSCGFRQLICRARPFALPFSARVLPDTVGS